MAKIPQSDLGLHYPEMDYNSVLCSTLMVIQVRNDGFNNGKINYPTFNIANTKNVFWMCIKCIVNFNSFRNKPNIYPLPDDKF